MSTLDELQQLVLDEVDSLKDELVRVAATLHANPEVAFEESESAALLAGVLENKGFSVDRGVAGLPTAFVATMAGREPGPTLAFLAEYDALPGLGHACGHNLIGTSALGAGLAMRSVLPELAGTIQVIGTPAEETGGGKAIMVDEGVFENVDAAMLMHPSDRNRNGGPSLSCYQVEIKFFGISAHAAVCPEKGVNALNALLLTFSGINALRQHVRSDVRIHGVITDGGQVPNIVPDYAAGRFYVRAADTPYASKVLEKVRACAEGAAQATGARMEFEPYGARYDARLPNPKLAELVEKNMTRFGMEVEKPRRSGSGMGSSDMGNVSQVIPALHPSFAIGPKGALPAHSVAFEKAAGSDAGYEGMINAAKIMALTAVELLVEPSDMREVTEAFQAQKME